MVQAGSLPVSLHFSPGMPFLCLNLVGLVQVWAAVSFPALSISGLMPFLFSFHFTREERKVKMHVFSRSYFTGNLAYIIFL